MKVILKRIFISMLTVLFLIGSAFSCLAVTENGKITVTLQNIDKNYINDVKVNICQIAQLNGVGYYPVTAFESSGISISGIVNNPDNIAAQTLLDYVIENNVQTISKVSDNGRTVFSELDLGIWLVYCDEAGQYKFNPYIVFLPYESGGKIYYEVSSAPKIEDSNFNEMNIYVFKKWDDKNNAAKKRPSEITVELLSGNTVLASVVLNDDNGWSYTFYGVEKDGQYCVREKNVLDYKANYSGDAVNGFVITNTYSGEKLPQTGQYWWPICIIAVAGICFVILGVYEIGAKKNVKKK